MCRARRPAPWIGLSNCGRLMTSGLRASPSACASSTDEACGTGAALAAPVHSSMRCYTSPIRINMVRASQLPASMATPTSDVAEYCSLLSKSKLLPPEEVESIHRRWKDETGSSNDQVEAFGKYL